MLPIMHNCRSVTHRFWILTHRLEICASSWHIHIFQAIKRVNGHLVHQQNKISKVQNEKTHTHTCWTTFLSAILIGLNVISGSCISKLIDQKFIFFLSCHFCSTPLISLRLNTCRFYLAYMCKEALSNKVRWKYYC